MELDSRIAERALAGHPTDELFRLLVTTVADYAIFLLDPAGHVVSWNTGAERIKGYAAAEIVGRHLSVFYPQEQQDAAAAALARAEREGRYQGEGWRVRKDGTRFLAEVTLTALRGPSGELRGFAKVTRDTTARQLSRENEATLAAMFERTPFGAAMIDPTGRFLRANPVFLRLSGCNEAELRSRTLGDLAHPEDVEAAWNVFEELVQGRRSHADFEGRMLRRNGQVISVRHTLARLADADGRLRCMLAMVEDITDRRFAYDALRESEARLQAFTNHSPALMYLKDAEGRYRFANERFLQRFGLRRDQVVGRKDGEVFALDQAAALAAHDAEVLERGAPVQYEQASQRVDGERFSVVSKFPVFDAGGAVVGLGAVATDITERRIAEQALREQRTLLAEAQKLAGLGCWEWDPVSGRVNWSDEMYSIYGVHPGEFRPSFESYLERIHPEDRARAAATVALALMDNRAFSMDERIVRPDGRVRQLRSHGEVVRDESGRPLKMVGACIDVTDQKAAEAALRALTRRLVQAEETERRRIARELHDRVGQNLSALNINLDILLGKLRDETARRRLEDSLKLVDATLQSIENVMADLRPALLDEYGLPAALAWYGEEYAQRTGIRVAVEAGEAGTGLRPEAAVALFRIAQEALNNAAKHSSAKRITVGLEEKGDELVLSVVDDGKGFDPAAAPRGRWGMTTMRERAEAAGGSLFVDSSVGEGTTVRAAVPL
ncbi:MAG TPA: PAS domain S-box protein [Burkholderiales bacterium]|nr:PAS domain S-box protein [Burkholderiales bacterium]